MDGWHVRCWCGLRKVENAGESSYLEIITAMYKKLLWCSNHYNTSERSGIKNFIKAPVVLKRKCIYTLKVLHCYSKKSNMKASV